MKLISIQTRILFLLAAMLLQAVLLTSGCIFDNDDNESKSRTPGLKSLSIADGDVITTRDLTVSWTPTGDADEFRMTLDGDISGWFDSTSVNLHNLEDIIHELTIEARRDTVYGDPVTVSFTVDAFTGPGISFSPVNIETVSYLAVALEDIEGLMAAHIEIVADEHAATFMNFLPGAQVEGGTPVLFHELVSSNHLIIDVGFGGMPDGASGRVPLGNIIVRPLGEEGTITVDIEKTVFRDTSNMPLPIASADSVRVL